VTEVSELRRKLDSSDPEKRKEAVVSLQEIAEENPEKVRQAVDGLRKGVEDNPYYNDNIRTKAVSALVELAKEYPEEVRPAAEDICRELHKFLNDESFEYTRRSVVYTLVELAKEYPEEVRPAAEDICRDLRKFLYDESKFTRSSAVSALAEIAKEYPEEVRPAADELRQLLDDEYDPVRRKAPLALAKLAEEYPEDVRPAADELRRLLDDFMESHEHRDSRLNAAEALILSAEEYPEDARPASDTFRKHLYNDIFARKNAAEDLAELAKEYPEEVRPVTDDLRKLLEDSGTRRYAALALRNLAEEYPEDVQPAIDDLRQLLNDEYKYARMNATSALAKLVEEYPEDVRPAAYDLRQLLNDEHEGVRGNAAWTLGKLAKEYPEDVHPAADKLRRIATNEDEIEAVKKTAELALKRLSEATNIDTEITETVTEGTEADTAVVSDDGERINESGTVDKSGATQHPQDGMGVIEPKRPWDVEVAPPPSLNPNRSDWERGRRIDTGGTAHVHKAKIDTAESTLSAAVKILSSTESGGTDDIEESSELLNEARNWEKIDDHDHIITLIDYGENPSPWILMELMDSKTLADRVPLEPSYALGVISAICDAVQYAHNEGIFHGDIKPANILFSKEGRDGVPKVGDWGLARVLADATESTRGKFTLRYAPPEMIRGEEMTGWKRKRRDVYQIGATAYHTLVGEPPFANKGRYEVRDTIMEETPTPPSEKRQDVPTILDEPILSALSKDPDDRQPSIRYLRDDLIGV